MQNLYIASDHGGFPLKQDLQNRFPQHPWKDLGTHSSDSVDYPDFSDKVCCALKTDPHSIGLLICGSGQGMALRANKYPHIRAALCWNEQTAELSRSHNDANILCLGARVIETAMAYKIFETFLKTSFSGDRHKSRIEKIMKETLCP